MTMHSRTDAETQDWLSNVRTPNPMRHKHDSSVRAHKHKQKWGGWSKPPKEEKDRTGYSPSNLAELLGTTIERKKK